MAFNEPKNRPEPATGHVHSGSVRKKTENERIWAKWLKFSAEPAQVEALGGKHHTEKAKAFIRMLAETPALKRGTLSGERQTPYTLRHYYSVLRNEWNRHATDSTPKFDSSDKENVENWINNDLSQELGLKQLYKSKPEAQPVDVRVIMEQLWYKDTVAYRQERYRVQLSFFILLMAYTAARPGAVAVPPEYTEYNEALDYEHAKLFVMREGDSDKIKFCLEITFIYLKDARAKSEIVDGKLIRAKAKDGKHDTIQKYLKMTLHENRDDRSLCPVSMFLSLAFSDQVFKYFRDIESLLNFKLREGKQSVEVIVKDECKELPLLRIFDQQSQEISETKAYTVRSSSQQMSKLGKRCGFKEPLSHYCFRRGSANILDSITTVAQRNVVLGHSESRIFEKHYSSRRPQVDLQGAVLRGRQDTAAAQHLASMSSRQERDAPVKIPMELFNQWKVSQAEWVHLNEQAQSTEAALLAAVPAMKNLSYRTVHTTSVRNAARGKLTTVQQSLFDTAVTAARALKNWVDREIRFKSDEYRANWFERRLHEDNQAALQTVAPRLPRQAAVKIVASECSEIMNDSYSKENFALLVHALIRHCKNQVDTKWADYVEEEAPNLLDDLPVPDQEQVISISDDDDSVSSSPPSQLSVNEVENQLHDLQLQRYNEIYPGPELVNPTEIRYSVEHIIGSHL